MKQTFFILIFFLLSKTLNAQLTCATPPYDVSPSVENQINDWISHHKNALQTRTIVTIPVVVHIVYGLDSENFTDAQVTEQINILNRDFRRRNADTTATPAVWKSLGADIDIQFCLASRDTLGKLTTGITRTLTTVTTFTNDRNVKSATRGGMGSWNPKKYFNIWVCNLTPTLYGTGTYAKFADIRPNEDGVVINYRNFGLKSSKIVGRTLVHEAGHWLNLLHIFGDSIVTLCVGRTDFVDDTPTQRINSTGCPSFPQFDGCTSTGSGNMFMNYMDYCDEPCMNLFTLGQKERMWAALNLFRPDILNSDGCLSVSTDDISLLPFTVSPNPIRTGFIQVESVEKNVDLIVSNMYGQIVFTKKNMGETELVDFLNLPSGVYFIRLKKGYKSRAKKVLRL